MVSARHKDTVMMSDDMDLLFFLLHMVEMDTHDLFLAPEPKHSSNKNSIKQSKKLLGPNVGDMCSLST